jgi:hypothetical protein
VLPGHGIRNKVYRWHGSRGALKVSTNISVVDVNILRRREKLRYVLHARKPSGMEKYESIYDLRTYTLSQFRSLVSLSGCFGIISVYDVDSGFAGPVDPDSSSENLAFILGKT